MSEQSIGSGSSAPSGGGGSSIFMIGRDIEHIKTCIKVQIIFKTPRAAYECLLKQSPEAQWSLKVFEVRICEVPVLMATAEPPRATEEKSRRY